MVDQDDRTTAIGFYNQAHSYWRSASALREANVRATHRDDPIWFLYFHAVELYLKSFLRSNGISVEEIREKYGHGIQVLYDKATSLGLQSNNRTPVAISMMSQTKPTELRYTVTGYTIRPPFEVLDETCDALHKATKCS